MKWELNQNDILLVKLACSALIAFFMIRFLLMPGIERLQENGIQNDALQETVTGMEEAIESIPVLEQSIESSKKDLAEVSAPYYESMENRQIDELLTGLALKHGLFPVSLSIDGAEASLPGPYLYGTTASQAAAVDASAGASESDGNAGGASAGTAGDVPSSVSGTADDTQGGGSGGVSGNAVEDAAREAEENAETAAGMANNPDGSHSIVSGGYMQTAAGHMVLQGDEAKLFAFLGDVEANYPAIRLHSLNIQGGVYFDEDWNQVERPDMSCELEIYMYDISVLE